LNYKDKLNQIIKDKKEASFLCFSAIPFTLGCDLEIFIYDIDRKYFHESVYKRNSKKSNKMKISLLLIYQNKSLS
jgi:hypothetical protein